MESGDVYPLILNLRELAEAEGLIARYTEDDGECWLLKLDAPPHLKITHKRGVRLNRLAYETKFEPIAWKKHLTPNCGKERCINPDHLYPADKTLTRVPRHKFRGEE